MGVIITPQSKIDEYFESDRKSQSKLKVLLGGLDSFLNNQQTPENELHYTEKGHFIIGSAVDLKLTGESHLYDEIYYVSDLDVKPSEVEMSITQRVFDDVIDSYPPIVTQEEGFEFEALSQYPGSIQMAVDEHGWQSRWKDETRVNKIIETCSMYFEDLKKAYGKQILSQEQSQTIDAIVMSLTTNRRTKDYFDRENQSRNNSVDYYYQLPIYFTHKDEECKALLDLVIVVKDENNRIVSVQGIDLKTFHGNTVDFNISVRQRRYDIQAAWYTLALQHWMSNNGYTLGEYNMHDFKWIVESTSITGNPLVYICDHALFEMGRIGRPKLINYFNNDGTSGYPIVYKEIKGYEQLIDDYKWFEENDWKEEKVVKENNGVLRIDWDGIIN